MSGDHNSVKKQKVNLNSGSDVSNLYSCHICKKEYKQIYKLNFHVKVSHKDLVNDSTVDSNLPSIGPTSEDINKTEPNNILSEEEGDLKQFHKEFGIIAKRNEWYNSPIVLCNICGQKMQKIDAVDHFKDIHKKSEEDCGYSKDEYCCLICGDLMEWSIQIISNHLLARHATSLEKYRRDRGDEIDRQIEM